MTRTGPPVDTMSMPEPSERTRRDTARAEEELTSLSEFSLEGEPTAQPARESLKPVVPEREPGATGGMQPGDLLKFTGLGLMGLLVVLGALMTLGTFQSFLQIPPTHRSWAVVGGFALVVSGAALFAILWGLGEAVRLLTILAARTSASRERD